VVAGFTTRSGGVSRGPWEGLDLGLHVGDDPDDVGRNRALVGEWAGAPVSFARQVHGIRAEVVDATPAPQESGDLFAAGGCDALVTARAAVPLGVLVADCVPVLLADPQAGVVAAAHAGRNGLLDGVLQATVRRMVALGARPPSVRAALGPCAGPCCYEVPQDMRAQACTVLPSLHATTRAGTPSLDLRAGCREALASAGVGRVDEVGGCTVEDRDLYSYRRAAVTGRFAGVVHLAGGSA
jgi:YfiH family protein